MPLPLDADGNVTALPSGETAERIVYADETYPAGDYLLLYDGEATFAVEGGAIVTVSPGRLVIRVHANDGRGLRLRLVSTNSQNYARNVRLVLPGCEGAYATQPFVPSFVARLRGAAILRFGEWMHGATYAASASWTSRPRVSDAAQTAAGVAPEFMILLANETGADPWFTLPVGATDAYAYGFARLVHQTLDPRLRPTFEYGGEVWRAGAPSNAYSVMAARNTGLGAGYGAALRWYAMRSSRIFAIVREAFGSDAARVVRVLAGPPADPRIGGVAIDAALMRDASGAADAFAVSVFDIAGDAVAAASFEQTKRMALAQHLPLLAYTTAASNMLSLSVRPSFVPMHGLKLVVGSDRSPASDREGPRSLHGLPPQSLGKRARVSALELHGRPGLLGALGVPLAHVDFAREGLLDWVDLDGSSPRGARRGFIHVDARSAIVVAPADPHQERVLRVYFSVRNARAAVVVRLGGAGYRDASLDARAGSRSGVYTFVFRATAPGERLFVSFIQAARYGPDASLVLRAVTLSPGDRSGYTEPPADEPLYHNDLLRTGWNPNETKLNVRNVNSGNFGQVATLNVDDDVLAQPLYLSNYKFPDGSKHDVLIVATGGDSIYEFDADTGATLNHVTLGTPEHFEYCSDIADVGIASTPVVDRARGTIYLVDSNAGSGFSDFTTSLYALDIGTLQQKQSPVAISASVTMSNGSQMAFSPQNQMNRPGLVLANDSLYIGIGSHCDDQAANITGWLLRYNLKLQQTGAFATAEDTASFLLDSIWMTGFAPAVDQKGNVYAVTGNGAFDGTHDWGESVLKLSPNLKKLSSHFTPSNYATLTTKNEDFGAGGIMLIPPQQGSHRNLAIAMGKAAILYLLDSDKLGGESSSDGGALEVIQDSGNGLLGGPAYYSGPTGEFVYYQTGDDVLHAYALQIDGKGDPSLTLDSSGTVEAGYGGSLPVVSSDGQSSGTGIVWLVNRGSGTLYLEAYDATDVSTLLYRGAAGTWSNPLNNGFVTPLVAGGKVYVTGSKTITVFGLKS